METAGIRNLQTRAYKQEIQLIQVARIGQAGRGASTTQAPLDWRFGEAMS
jgi:hypothetical protein